MILWIDPLHPQMLVAVGLPCVRTGEQYELPIFSSAAL
jgi:hypothetical protein